MDEYTYLKFDAPSSNNSPSSDGLLKKAIKVILEKVLTTIFPSSNPDFEHLFSDVVYWKVEINLTEDCVWREIGFDKDNIGIVAMPDYRNYGFWLDSNMKFQDFEAFNPTPVSPEEFNSDFEKLDIVVDKTQGALPFQMFGCLSVLFVLGWLGHLLYTFAFFD